MTTTYTPTRPAEVTLAANVANRWLMRELFVRDYTTDLILEAMLGLARVHDLPFFSVAAWWVWEQRGHRPGDRIPFEHEPFTNLYFELYRDSNDKRFIEPFVAESRRCRELTLRSDDQAIRHPPTDPKGMVLIDAVQAYAARMARTGWLTGEVLWFDDAVAQLLGSARILIDPETGLWRHSRDHRGVVNPFCWSRAQGWALRGIVETLRYLPAEHPGTEPLKTLLARTIDSLAAYQTDGGAWRLLVDRPNTMPESSGTAMIHWAMAVSWQKQWIQRTATHRRMMQRANRAMRRFVSEQGLVKAGCPGTGPRPTLESWLGLRLEPDDPHAIAAAIWALTEYATVIQGDHS